MFKTGQTVKVINTEPLKGKEIAPPLDSEKEYKILGICKDSQGNQHLNVGLISKVSYVTSYETGEELPNGHIIHWCHPSRFELI